MENNSFLLAIILAIPYIVNSIVIKRRLNKNKKNIGHYEAISDEHCMKLYNPVSTQILTVIGLLIVSFYVSCKYLIFIYVLTNIFSTIIARLRLLQSDIDLLSIKNGLIRVYYTNTNPYNIADNINIECSDEYTLDGEISKTCKRLFYKLNDKIIYSHCMDINNLTSEQIEKRYFWYKERFKDYCRYIPENVFKREHSKDTLDYWFTYLDDLRSNY